MISSPKVQILCQKWIFRFKKNTFCIKNVQNSKFRNFNQNFVSEKVDFVSKKQNFVPKIQNSIQKKKNFVPKRLKLKIRPQKPKFRFKRLYKYLVDYIIYDKDYKIRVMDYVITERRLSYNL